MSSEMNYKPVIAGGIAFAIDQMYLKERVMMRSAYFAGAVAVGLYGAEYVHPIIKQMPIPSISKNLYDGKTLVERIAEVGISAGMIYILNKYVLSNDFYSGETMQRLGVIAVSDIGATYITEYMNSKPLEFLTNN